ncbi:hypothetical protein [Streptomyces sp. NPDC018031]|uniref:hypothetical protein n=1 Tax=Streptomyces sp. NPDC018031 TaxID=3365033 RepID=UPI0037A9AAC8
MPGDAGEIALKKLQKARDAAKDLSEDSYKKWQGRGGDNGDMFQVKFLAAGCIADVLDFALNND